MMTVYFGTLVVATAVTILAPSLAMPPASYLRPTMKPVMFCRNSSGMLRWLASSMKCVPLRALAEQDPVVGKDADRETVDMGEAANERLPIERLELLELGSVDDARDHVANVVGRARVRGHDAVEVVRREQRLLRLADLQKWMLQPVEAGDDAARDADGVTVVGGVIVGDAGLPAMHVGAAQLLCAHVLPGRRLHQRRPAEEDRALIAHDDALIRHRRYIGAAGGAGAHHDRDLGNAER